MKISSFIETPKIPMNGVGKRSINRITSSDIETQNLGSSIIPNTFVTTVFGQEKLRNMIAFELDVKDLNQFGAVSKYFLSIYQDMLVNVVNIEKGAFEKYKISSLEKFIECLKGKSHQIVNLNLAENKYVIGEFVIKEIVKRFPALTSLSLRRCKILDPGTSFTQLGLLPLKKLDISACQQKLTMPSQLIVPFDNCKSIASSFSTKDFTSLDSLRNFTSLESLDISHFPHVYDYNFLNKLTNLKALNLESNNPNFNFLEYCTQINELNFKGCKYVDFGPFNQFFQGNKCISIKGDTYECQIVNGRAEGFLVKTNTHGIKRFEGYLIAGEHNGQGIHYYKNGNKEYEGIFLNNERHGQGILFNPNGKKVFEGNFLNDRPGDGIWYLANGDKFEGRFQFDMDDNFCVGKLITLKEEIVDTKISFSSLDECLEQMLDG